RGCLRTLHVAPRVGKTDSVIDLGTGTGGIPLMLSCRTPVQRVTGVEIDAEAASVARRNIEANGLEDRVTIIEGDYREVAGSFSEGAFTVVVSNPPYVKAGTGRVSPSRGRDAARCELRGGLKDLVAASRHLAGDTGRAYFVFPVARLFEMLRELKQAGLKTGRLRFVHTDKKKPARLFLIEAGRGAGLELKIEEPLFLRD
ncbi:MAG TPA: methyltransferase, partial [Thermodesulfobacteriota bacterium]|nr:methyltransferase [Thermodesulfobacteriota bacterium]